MNTLKKGDKVRLDLKQLSSEYFWFDFDDGGIYEVEAVKMIDNIPLFKVSGLKFSDYLGNKKILKDQWFNEKFAARVGEQLDANNTKQLPWEKEQNKEQIIDEFIKELLAVEKEMEELYPTDNGWHVYIGQAKKRILNESDDLREGPSNTSKV